MPRCGPAIPSLEWRSSHATRPYRLALGRNVSAPCLHCEPSPDVSVRAFAPMVLTPASRRPSYVSGARDLPPPLRPHELSPRKLTTPLPNHRARARLRSAITDRASSPRERPPPFPTRRPPVLYFGFRTPPRSPLLPMPALRIDRTVQMPRVPEWRLTRWARSPYRGRSTDGPVLPRIAPP